MAMAEGHKSSSGKYVVVYLCLLAIAALQFVIAYSNISGEQMFTRMLILAVIEAALALLFFMHLSDNRGLLWFVTIITVFVLLAMQYSWTDSFRELFGAPWSQYQKY
ncbi:MAG: cytochrome C oxidase subunit IV family protein [Terriglobales bacterium]